jgi:hypothetical protein
MPWDDAVRYQLDNECWPTTADAIQALGGDPENAIDADNDLELSPYFVK